VTTTARVLRIATRGSRLALWQAHAVADRLKALGTATELVVLTTTGDRSQRGPVPGDDSKRQFVKELEDALLRGDADLAVHSAKDLPVALPDGLAIAACLPREDARDAIVLPNRSGAIDVAQVLARLGNGARVGTGSIRRQTQLARLLPSARFAPIRGNVDTRLAKLDAGEFDALVLACAGLRRLGFGDRIAAALPIEQCVPAPGQGIVAVEIAASDAATHAAVAALDDVAAGRALAAERAVVTAIGGGCQLPLGAYVSERDGMLELTAVVASLDGTHAVHASLRGPIDEPEGLGRRVADELARQGARELLAATTSRVQEP
jgi:hydroxymethylbilane synthase